MSFESNNGTQYYPISCGVTTVTGWDANTNNGSAYYGLSSNDFILWGQSTLYTHPSSNNGSTYYFYQCVRATDTNWSPLSNNGTNFYYSSAFNCVSFCDGVDFTTLNLYINLSGEYYLQPDGFSFYLYP
jgi:hypothetical protein